MALVYNTPNFNLNVHIWRGGLVAPPAPPVAPPSVATIGNLMYGYKEGQFLGSGGPTMMWLLLPKLVDVRSGWQEGGGAPDWVEVPVGTGRFYIVINVDDAAKGFGNEHRIALIYADGTIPWPVPYP